MNYSLINSTVAMRSLQQHIDIVANNTANINTTGYKRKEASFIDVLTSVQQQPAGQQQLPGRLTPAGLRQGAGAQIGMVQTDFTQGSLRETGHPLDFAIGGGAFFELAVPVVDAAGGETHEAQWTRDGAFQLSYDPQNPDTLTLTSKQGHFVRGIDNEPIRIPTDHRIQTLEDGTVLAFDERNPELPPIAVGQLKVIRILQPDALEHTGDQLYRIPEALDGEGLIADNVPEQPVQVRQGFLEQSNVNLADEMSTLIMLQRAYQLNSRAIQSTDAMMNMANNLRG